MTAITRIRSNPYPDRAVSKAEIMFKTVAHSSLLPLPPAHDIPLVISTTHTAIPSICGLIYGCADGVPATVEAVAANEKSPVSWVVVRHPDGHLAVTIEQAYMLGLREVETFGLQTSRYSPGSAALNGFFRG